MEPKTPYIVNSDAPRKSTPEPERKWPRWYCPRCQAKHYLEIDVLMAVTRLECSACKTAWNVLITFTDANARPKRMTRLERAIGRASEDDIVTDYDGGETLAQDAQDVVE